MLEEDLELILDPRKELTKIQLMVKKKLFDKYPKPLSKEEQRRAEEQQMMKEMEEELQNMYKGEDEED